MAEQVGRAVSVAVVGGDGDRGAAIDAALSAEASVSVSVRDSVDAVIATADERQVDAVVVAGAAETYRTVRDRLPTVPIVVVAAAIDPNLLASIVEDDNADHVAPDAVEAALPVCLRALVDRNRVSVTDATPAVTREAVVEFDVETGALLDADDAFFERWGWDRDRLTESTLADLRETDITYEHRGRGRGEGEEEHAWIRYDDPVESLIDNAIGNRYETREWHCHDADGNGFKATVRVHTDTDWEADVRDEAGTDQDADQDADQDDYPDGPSRTGRGRLVATVPPVVDETELAFDEGAMLRSLMDHVPMSVYFKDEDSRHVLVSEDVVEPFIESPEGKIMHTPADVHSKTDFDLYPIPVAEEAVEDDRGVMETGEPIRGRVEPVQPPHGRPLYFQTTKAPWYDDAGRVRGIVGATVDITEQKRREEELDRQNERLEEFASFVSHDLRNPLNVAKGRLQLYRQTGDESQLETVAEMHERMEELINDALTFAHQGDRVEETEWIDPHTVVEPAWESVETGDATLETDLDHEVEVDPGRTVRLLENLFRNAVEHGGEDVTIRVGTLEDDAGFYVEDDGPGIPEEDREEVFDRGVTSSAEGTGFGLAIVREIAEAHGWTVELTESDDGGARFEFIGVPRGSDLED